MGYKTAAGDFANRETLKYLIAYHGVVGVDYQPNERLSLTVDNLFNKLYKEYPNRSRYYAHDMGRDVRLQVNWLF